MKLNFRHYGDLQYSMRLYLILFRQSLDCWGWVNVKWYSLTMGTWWSRCGFSTKTLCSHLTLRLGLHIHNILSQEMETWLLMSPQGGHVSKWKRFYDLSEHHWPQLRYLMFHHCSSQYSHKHYVGEIEF